jgi:uncharacterized protein
MSKSAIDAVSASADMCLHARVAALDWKALAGELDSYGCVVLPNVLTHEECRTIAALYRDESHFRSRISGAPHAFSEEEYRWFNCPLPELLEELPAVLYSHLVGLASQWNERMGIDQRYPESHAAYLKHCHRAGETARLVRYFPGAGQGPRGDLVFPIQVAILRINSEIEHTIGIIFLEGN